ncbi:MAG: aminoacyltransferase FemX [Candidatus Parcubacteria bacterium]|jgi:lipid II:glycine glycyltransferase (peptidoglycan interpeptide bridge formation enzyme)
MPLLIVKNASEWDAFISSQPRAQFTQSWAWGEFRKSRGQEVIRLSLTDSAGEWEAAAMFFKISAPLVGGYWYAQRGPVVRDHHAFQSFLSALTREDALPGRALFWRMEPTLPLGASLPAALTRSHAYMPASTLYVNLAASEELLQKQMHEKTRYNIRVAERHGVTVRTSADDAAIGIFLRLTEETAARDKFLSQPASYIRGTVASLAAKGMARIRIAEKAGVPLAASVEVLFGDTVTYLYGASSSAERGAMAPYALHWEAIKSAKREGYGWYDFYGVNPANTASSFYKKSWEGITRFKRGWGGESVDYAGTWELPRMPLSYRLFRLVRPV